VVDRLRDMILDNEFAVGERLHDANLAEALGVSRTPVRKAVKLLATEGLVDLLPGRGARVAAYSGSRHRTGRIARFAARTGNTVRLRLPSTDRQRRRGAA